MRKFLIATAGRTGSTRMANIMQAMGFNCGHEGILSTRWAHGYVSGADRSFPTALWEAHDGDCGWPSYPGLHLLPEGTVLFHMVRHPLDMAWSYVNGWKTADVDRVDKQWLLIEHCRLVSDEFDRTMRAQREFWLDYWKHHALGVEEAGRRKGITYHRFRIEDLEPEASEGGLDALSIILAHLGSEEAIDELMGDRWEKHGWTPEYEDRLRMALDKCPVGTNGTAAHHDAVTTWEGVDPEVKALARRYGYTVEKEVAR